MLRKLVVVYDKQATNYPVIQREIANPARKVQGFLVGKFVWQPVSFNQNAKRLAEFLHDGDLVVVAGGDALASMAANAILLARKDVALAVFGFGFSNDICHLARTKRPVLYGDEFLGGIEEVVRKFDEQSWLETYPLLLKVNGKKWRYALNYASIGSLAKLTQGVSKRPRSYFGLKLKLLSGYLRFNGRNKLDQAILNVNSDKIQDSGDIPEEISEEPVVEESVEIVAKAVAKDVPEDVPETATKSVPEKVAEKSAKIADKHVTEKEIVIQHTVGEVAESSAEIDAKENLARSSEEKGDFPKVAQRKAIKTSKPEQCKYEIAIPSEIQRKSRSLAGAVEQLVLINLSIRRWGFDRRAKRCRLVVACAVEKRELPEPEEIKREDNRESQGQAKENSRKLPHFDAGEPLSNRTDVFAINGLTFMGGLRGRRFYKNSEVFLLKTLNLHGFWRLLGFYLKGKIFRVGGKRTKRAEINFLEESTVVLQTDNTTEELNHVKKIEIVKSKQKLKLVKF